MTVIAQNNLRLENIFYSAAAPKTAWQLFSSLNKNGWKETGTNYDDKTRIFHKPYTKKNEPSVIRVNTLQDLGFYNYAQLCIEHPSPHFQKIHGHGFLKDGITHVTLTERLYPAPSISRAQEPLKSQLKAFWETANKFFPYATSKGTEYSPLEEEQINVCFDLLKEQDIKSTLTKFESELPTLANAFLLLQQSQLWLCSQNPKFGDPYPDFSPANIMIRKEKDGQKTIVLADPFAFDPLQTEFYVQGPQYREMKKAFGEPPANISKAFKVDC